LCKFEFVLNNDQKTMVLWSFFPISWLFLFLHLFHLMYHGNRLYMRFHYSANSKELRRKQPWAGEFCQILACLIALLKDAPKWGIRYESYGFLSKWSFCHSYSDRPHSLFWVLLHVFWQLCFNTFTRQTRFHLNIMFLIVGYLWRAMNFHPRF